ncbi:hypothetical protein [Actinobacillus vicugnae]|uniref:hypothetical protein n=1 Tax=Actinobacillus vicugnae TaxID=2573093 RepID=UPI0012403EF0|nr:hypothetical protein [Actinobacillus vicugnae]
MIVFINVFFKTYSLLIICGVVSIFVGGNLYFLLRDQIFFWDILLNPIVLKLIFVPTAFISFALAFLVAIAHKRSY